MRIMGFSKKWEKLQKPEFITFRFARRDRDWAVEEKIQIVIQPRRKGGGEKLGIAEIINKEPRDMIAGRPHQFPVVNLPEIIADGFDHYWQMWDWLVQQYSREKLYAEPMNKLTLRKIGGW